ncbi:MAG: CBS domain-containing protein [Treponema sp.]|nr:CBS domain-containing protein [Treponema sp.]
MSDTEQMEDIPLSSVDSPAVVLELIHQLKIKDVMTNTVLTGNKKQTMRHVQSLLRENKVAGIPITDDDNKLIGIVSTEDIINALDKGYIDALVEDKMIKNVIHLQDDMPVSFAISYLNKYKYGRFPVLNKNNELVGILTSTDVIRNLLIEMNREVLRLEKLHKSGENAPSAFSEMEFRTMHYNFEIAGRASTEIKKALKQRNFDPKLIRRIAIACYELEINQVVHSNGGVICCSILPDKVVITAADTGPGIADVNQALKEGYSTANEYIRSLGFGAGMGLANTKRVSDDFSINSELGKGTTVRSVVFVDSTKDEN